MGPPLSRSASSYHTTHDPVPTTQHKKRKTTKHNQDTHKPVCTIRSLSGSFGQRGFCFIIQTESRFLVSSRGRRIFLSPSTRYTFRREQSRITVAVVFVSVFQRYPTRARSSFLQRDTIITRPAPRSKDGCNGSHDHVIAAADMVAHFCLLQVYRNSKSYRCFSSLCFFLDLKRVFFVSGWIE